ncbi:MAG: M13 family metallopeptidase [Rhodococcus sp. (in: high G+C Gram-positive bacteria)]|uniref:M13 family metallopeptidase n=1 Tax=Rhodococcus sp. TaxID=1831 RepID=UPI003BB61777
MVASFQRDRCPAKSMSTFRGKPQPAEETYASTSRNAGELDSTVSPCVDFYAFVNNKWLENTDIPAGKRSVGAVDGVDEQVTGDLRTMLRADGRFSEVNDPDLDNARALYAEATDRRTRDSLGAAPIADELAAIAAIASPADIRSYLFRDSARNLQPLIMFDPGRPTGDEVATPSVTLMLPYFGPPPATGEVDPAEHDKAVRLFRTYTDTALRLAGISPSDIPRETDRYLEMSDALSAVDRADDSSSTYDVAPVLTLEEATTLTPDLKWQDYFDAVDVPTTSVSLTNPKALQAFAEAVEKLPVEQWRAYLTINLVAKTSPYLSSELLAARTTFEANSRGIAPPDPDADFDEEALHGVLFADPARMSQAYARYVFGPDAKRRASELVTLVKDAFRQRLSNAQWLEPETRTRALDKLDQISIEVGYPDEWPTMPASTPTSKGEYYRSILMSRENNFAYLKGLVGKTKDELESTSGGMATYGTNAAYNPVTNSIQVTAAFLQPPFFDDKDDTALNLGRTGYIIGHELTHAFDREGSKYDGAGNEVEWWTARDAAEFTRLNEQLISQYNAYTPIPERPDLHVDGEASVGENVADLGGINTVADIVDRLPERDQVIDGYTTRQWLYISYARVLRKKMILSEAEAQMHNEHPLPSVRVNGVLVNTPGFADAFGCSPGDPMVNESQDRVAIW